MGMGSGMDLLDKLFARGETASDQSTGTAARIAVEPASAPTGDVPPSANAVELPASIPFPKHFTGRSADLDDLASRHESGQRLFVLHGPGGTGKTALARRFAETIAGGYDAFIELAAGANGGVDVMRGVLRAFDADAWPGLSADDVRAEVLAYTADHPTLVIVDDAAEADAAAELAAGGCCVVVTQKSVADGDGAFEVGKLSDDDAVDLLCAQGGAERVGDHAWHIARRSGNSPLAILLARGLIVNQPQIDVELLSERLRLQRLQYIDEVAGAIRMTYEALGGDLQRRWRQLSVFPGTFDAAAAAAVLRDDHETAKTSLVALAAYRMLEAYPAATGRSESADPIDSVRFRMHETVRSHAAKTISGEESSAAAYGHSRYYAEQLETAGDADGRLAFFDLERHNVVAGFERARATVKEEPAYAEVSLFYTAAAPDVIARRVAPADLLAWAGTGIDAARIVGDAAAEISLLASKGAAHKAAGEFPDAIACFESAAELAERSGDDVAAARSLNLLGTCCDSISEGRRAVEAYESAITMLEPLGEVELLASVQSNLGVSLNRMRHYRESLGALGRAVHLVRQIPDRAKEVQILSNLAATYINMGDTKQAFNVYKAAMSLARESGDARAEAIQLGNIAGCYFKLGKAAAAVDLWKRAIAALDEMGSPAAEVFRRRLKTATSRH